MQNLILIRRRERSRRMPL